MCGLITYMKHVFGAYNSDIDPRDDPFHPFSPEEWSQQTSTMDRSQNISLHFICITFHLHYITFAFKNRATSA